jgi:hypothetical protein
MDRVDGRSFGAELDVIVPAQNLAGGFVLVHPAAAGVVSRALAAAEQLQRRDGYLPPADFALLVEVFAVATQEQRSSTAGRSEVPRQRPSAESAPSVRMVLADPVTAEQAAEILGCTSRNVRDLCSRGVFESAQRNRSGWEIERAEVAERLQGPNSADSPARGKGRGTGGWAAFDQQPRRGTNARW